MDMIRCLNVVKLVFYQASIYKDDNQCNMNILHIDTATPVCSVALSINGTLSAYRDQNEPNVHASKLTLFIEELLLEAQITINQLNAVSVSKGPGSYTGLRIGVSVAKGICYALDIPLIAVNTLDALAQGFKISLAEESNPVNELNTLFCPMIDARRMEVYTAIYDVQLKIIEPTAARIIESDSFDYLTNKHQLIMFGDGADKLSDLFSEHASIQIHKGFQNSARYLIPETIKRFNQQQFEDVAYFEPFYLKDFIPTSPKRLIKS